MIEQVELQAVSEASFDVMKEKGIYIIIFGILEAFIVVSQVIAKQVLTPKILHRINEQRIIKQKAKNSILDL